MWWLQNLLSIQVPATSCREQGSLSNVKSMANCEELREIKIPVAVLQHSHKLNVQSRLILIHFEIAKVLTTLLASTDC